MAAAQIYNMLSNYKGRVTVKIDGIAASAASVIAMAGTEVFMSPVSMLMIHNPATIAMGDHAEMQKAIDMLAEVKESIINAYVIKTGMSRAKLSRLMDAETWMDANKAVELGFADEILVRASKAVESEADDTDSETHLVPTSMLFSRMAVDNAFINKLEQHYSKPKSKVAQQVEIPVPDETGRNAEEIRERLNFMKKFI